MSSRRSGGGSSSRSGRGRTSVKSMIKSLNNHSVNTLTELCRIERIAAACEDEADAKAFQEPMTAAWVHYVTSNQLLLELRGFTNNYPMTADIVHDAVTRVRADPHSNRSWNLAWLCLNKMRDDGLIEGYAEVEASKQEMWGSTLPTQEEVQQLAACFEYEWNVAVDTMLRHWQTPPSWY
ncbi:hypothetical protein B0J13DRAFT_148385 [Dactylonectria estremocensis]|uniref:Uncharacterized protein n=1 Tax=Dactylonectria estremocensis TaxID=1079267 RepID=A0A9P9IPB5_9HYPO|nr:hypothetical protein B0J13DRAFT_148385 [Dactylonectria estremocensis]